MIDDVPLHSRRRTLVSLLLLAIAAVGIRQGYLSWAVAQPGFGWGDADYYLDSSALLRGAEGQWTWNVDALRWFGYVRAPLFVFYLAIFQPLGEGAYLAATRCAILLEVLTLAGAYLLGRSLADRRTGLAAAALYALWFPAVAASTWVRQERLYVPLLVLALGLLAAAWRARARPRDFAIAGVVLGLAALARSMPLYLLPLAAAANALRGEGRRDRVRAAALVLGFALPTLPWSAFVSSELGRPVAIENIGAHGLVLAYPEAYEAEATSGPPSTLGSLRVLGRALLDDPVAFVRARLAVAGGLFRLTGGSWLLVDGSTRDRSEAWWLTWSVRILLDLVFALIVVAAPFGWALARDRSVANLCALWVGVHVALTALAGYAGQRFRFPLDAVAIALAATTLTALAARERPAIGRQRLAIAGALVLALAIPVLGSAPASLAFRARYGTGRWLDSGGHRVTNLSGDAGFHAFAATESLETTFWRGPQARGEQALRVLIDGDVVGTVRLPEGDSSTHTVTGPATPGAYAWVEVQCLRCEGGRKLVSVAVGTPPGEEDSAP